MLPLDHRLSWQAFYQIVTPVFGQGWGRDRFVQQVAIVFVVDEEVVHFCDGDGLRFVAQKLESISGLYDAFLLHGKVKSAAAATQEASEDIRPVKFQRELVTGDARLTDHEDAGDDLEPISDVKVVFKKSPSGEVFSEHAPGKLCSRQFLLPEWIVLRGVGVHSLERPAVNREIGLAIAIEV